MVLHILFSTIGTVVFLSLSSTALADSNSWGNRCYSESYTALEYQSGYWSWNTWTNVWISSGYKQVTRYRDICDEDGISTGFITMCALMVIFALAEFVINIWTAALSCGAVCRCCKTSVAPAIHLVPRSQQVVVQSTPISTMTAQYNYQPGYQQTTARSIGVFPHAQNQQSVGVNGNWSAPQQINNWQQYPGQQVQPPQQAHYPLTSGPAQTGHYPPAESSFAGPSNDRLPPIGQTPSTAHRAEKSAPPPDYRTLY